MLASVGSGWFSFWVFFLFSFTFICWSAIYCLDNRMLVPLSAFALVI